MLQAVTVPLAIAFQIKSAWVSCYIFAFFYAKLVAMRKEDSLIDLKRLNAIAIVIGVVGITLRILANDLQLTGALENLKDLCVQYITCVQAAAVFIAIEKLVNNFKLISKELITKMATAICAISYEVYIVQGFYCDEIFTSQLFEGKVVLNTMTIVVCTLISANLLNFLTKAV